MKKTDYDTKITEIEKKLTDHKHDEYIDTSEFNKLATNVFNARLVQTNLITKTDFDVKLSSLNKKITLNKTRHLLIENELNKLKVFDLSYFGGKSHFGEDGTQNYLVFQPMYRYFRLMTNTSNILSWKSKGLFNESITPPNTNISPSFDYVGNKIRIKFNGSCLKQSNKISYTHKNIINIYTVYEINKKDNTIFSNPTLKNCLFGAVTLTKNADIDKYGYSGYGTGFNRKGEFSFLGGEYGQNVTIFGVDMSSSFHIDNKKRHINIRNSSDTGIRKYCHCRKNVFY